MASRTGLTREAVELPQYITDEVIENTKELIKNYHVIGFDETQFFKGKILELIQAMIFSKRVIVSGLNMDYEGIPFGKMESIKKVKLSE